MSYRKLARTYRALDFWHERFKQRYQQIADGEVPVDAGKQERDRQ